MEDWKKLKIEIDNAAENSIEKCPDDVIRVFQFDISPNGGGTGGLMMANWYESAFASRYLCSYYFYNIIKLANSRQFSLKRIKQLINLLIPKEQKTAHLTGMTQLANYVNRVALCVNDMDSLEDVLCLMNAVYLYGSSINAWQNYMFKWGLNSAFMIQTKDDLNDMGSLSSDSFS